MGTDEIDPVQFGRLLELGEQNRETLLEIRGDLHKHVDQTNAQLKVHSDKIAAIDARDENRKHLLFGALGAGTIGGATFGEAIKNFFKHLIS
jgi:hypothetical protein